MTAGVSRGGATRTVSGRTHPRKIRLQFRRYKHISLTFSVGELSEVGSPSAPVRAARLAYLSVSTARSPAPATTGQPISTDLRQGTQPLVSEGRPQAAHQT